MTHEKTAIRTSTGSKKNQHFPPKSAPKNGWNKPFLKPFDTPFDTFLTRHSDILTGHNLTEAGTVCDGSEPLSSTTKKPCFSRTNYSIHISALLSDCLECRCHQILGGKYSPISGTPLDIPLFTLQNRVL
jgi:hypothetical protein